MKRLFIRKSLFVVPLVVLFVTLLYPQTGRAQCWWCSPDPSVTNSQNPWGYSPGFDLVVCFDDLCRQRFLPPSGLQAPKVTINNSAQFCSPSTDITLTGTAICAARNDGVLEPDSVRTCDVSIKVKNASCTRGVDGELYSRFQSAKENPQAVYDPASIITIPVPDSAKGPKGYPCPDKDATGKCTTSFFFPIGTELCTSFNGCIAKIYPATGDGISFDSLGAGQVLKGVQKDNFLSSRGCKGVAQRVGESVNPTSISCQAQGKILTGGGEASVGVHCPTVRFAGQRLEISPNSSNNGFDLFGNDPECPLNGYVLPSIKLNTVLTTSCQPQAGTRVRCFVNEAAVYTALACVPGQMRELVATGDINVPQGTGTVTVPFVTTPGQMVTCK